MKHCIRILTRAALGFTFCLLLSCHPAFAAKPEPCSADPDSALIAAVKQYNWQVDEMSVMRMRILPKLSIEDAKIVINIGSYAYKYLDLQDGSALMFYSASATHVCVFLWTNPPARGSRISFLYARHEVPPTMIDKLAGEFVRSLKVDSLWSKRSAVTANGNSPAGATINQPIASKDQLTARLSAVLFPETFRSALRRTTNLTVIPIRGMSSIPFWLLEPLGDGQKIVDLFPVNFMATLADIKELKRSGAGRWQKVLSPALVVGNPRPSIDPQFNWPPLLAAKAEAAAVHAEHDGLLLIEENATRANVFKAIENARFVHLAAHGYADPIDALDGSFVVLADGRLTAREIQSFKLSSQPLVILSACQTAEGFIMPAGIVGLARAFQLAGADTTIMSLWEVYDAATAMLMTALSRKISSMPPAEALRRAMIETRGYYPDPAYWASFNVFGNR